MFLITKFIIGVQNIPCLVSKNEDLSEPFFFQQGNIVTTEICRQISLSIVAEHLARGRETGILLIISLD